MAATAQSPIAIVIHGGAGKIDRKTLPPEREKQYHTTLTRSLKAGHAILKKGGSALEAVEAAIIVLEDSPLFNACNVFI